MAKSLIFALILASAAMSGCAANSSGTPADPGASSDDLTSSTAWVPLMDTCVQYAVSAAAVDAFADNNLQHLRGISVDGDLAIAGTLNIKVTTGNDEDGDSSRTVEVAQAIDGKTGVISCTVNKVSGKAPASSRFDKNALSAVVDHCTGTAIVAAQKLSDNYWHLYGLSLDDGGPAQSGDLKYTVTGGNDEDGNTDYKITVSQTISGATGKSTCKVTSSASTR